MHRPLMVSRHLRSSQEASQRLRETATTAVNLNDVRSMNSEGHVGIQGVHGLSLMRRTVSSTLGSRSWVEEKSVCGMGDFAYGIFAMKR